MSTAATSIVTDLNGRILDASNGTGALLGIEERWLNGKPLAAFVSEAQRRAFRTLLLDLGHSGSARASSFDFVRRDGEPLSVEVEVVSSDGERLEWLLSWNSAAGSAAPHRAAKPLTAVPLQRLVARLPIGVVSMTSELVVRYLNPPARLFLPGAQVGGLLPEPWENPSLRKFAARIFGSVPPARQLVEAPSGRLLELEGIHGRHEDDALLLIHDVSTRERRQRAEREFVTNAAHELRTPIAAIVSTLDVLEAGAKDVPADLERFLAHLRTESDRLERLVGALLMLARIQNGQQVPSLQLVALAPLLEDVAAALQPRPGVNVAVRCSTGVAVLADAELLRQAVWNIAANAATHTARGEIRLSGRDLGRVSEIEVRDTGPGMSPDEIEHAFDRFYRARRAETVGGFGLGLPIAREIARVLDGVLRLESQPDVGTCARLQVPSAKVRA
jgi:PAS domain S-box-containing protein